MMILYAKSVADAGYHIKIRSSDTDVLLLSLRRVPILGEDTTIISGVGPRRREIHIGEIYEKLGKEKSEALIKWHALTGCDCTGRIQGKTKVNCLSKFMAPEKSVIQDIGGLGVGTEPTEDVISGCMKFLMSLFSNDVNMNPATCRWSKYKHLPAGHGVEALPPTEGAWLEHIKRAHFQALVWDNDCCEQPCFPAPESLGWIKDDGRYLPVLSKVEIAPTEVTELSCSSGRCSCKAVGLECTELCVCETVDCGNTRSDLETDS